MRIASHLHAEMALTAPPEDSPFCAATAALSSKTLCVMSTSPPKTSNAPPDASKMAVAVLRLNKLLSTRVRECAPADTAPPCAKSAKAALPAALRSKSV